MPYNMTMYDFSEPPTSTSGWNTESTGYVLAFDGSNDYIKTDKSVAGVPAEDIKSVVGVGIDDIKNIR